jgi:hypothetical protein
VRKRCDLCGMRALPQKLTGLRISDWLDLRELSEKAGLADEGEHGSAPSDSSDGLFDVPIKGMAAANGNSAGSLKDAGNADVLKV